MNKKIMLSGISIIAAVSLMVGATYAYFTANANSTGNTFTAGTLTLSVLDQNGTDIDFFQGEILSNNWAPGETTYVNFDVKNTGSLPIHLWGNASGSWGDSGLDTQNKVRVIQVERFDGSDWVNLLYQPLGITGNFYYTNTGNVGGTPYVVNSGERAQLRLTVEFVSTAGDDFQNEVFTTSIQINGKQTNAPW